MEYRGVRPLVVTGVVLILIAPVLFVAGALTRTYVHDAFRSGEAVRAARDLGFRVLALELDKETGVRGFAATGDRLFLQPYSRARDRARPTLDALAAAVRGLSEPAPAAAAVADAIATDEAWDREVGQPLSARSAASTLSIERRGKVLIDRYRADIARVNDILEKHENRLDDEAAAAINRIGTYVALAVLAVVACGVAYGVQQSRLAHRLDEEQRARTRLQMSYDAEKRMTNLLQDAFLQRPLPKLQSVRFSATYVPATDEAKVGGDWYDGFELTRDRVMFVIGDVAGHGLEAAVAMNHARQALASAAVLDPDPARVLTNVNLDLLRQRGRMVTAVCGFADSRSFELTYAVAGHPPPVLVEPGRAPRLLDCGSLPLAIDDRTVYTTKIVQTVPGAMLVLYTDGAVEHSRDVLAGEAALLEAVRLVAGRDVPNVAAAIHARIFEGRATGDDVAIMTVTFAATIAAAPGEKHAGSVARATGTRGMVAGFGGTVVSREMVAS